MNVINFFFEIFSYSNEISIYNWDETKRLCRETEINTFY